MYTILTYPNPILRQKAKPVTLFDDNLLKIINNMAETMFDAPGAGLAAPQIGISQQIVVINRTEESDEDDTIVPEKKFLALINPIIYEGEGSQVAKEGCLSVLDYSAKVKRFFSIKVKALSPSGEKIEFEADDFFARVIQHEVDHLEGKLFIDRISSLKRNLYKKRLKKLLAEDKAEK